MAKKSAKTSTAAPSRSRASGIAGATAVNLSARTRRAPVAPRGLPIGADTMLAATATDVANQLDALAPTFGEILKSVGSGLANAQRALDKSVMDTVNKLATTKIDVVTDVVQRLDDATGLPMEPADTDLIKQQLSVLNFVTPTVHEFKYMALTMDLSIAKLDQKVGMSFTSASLNTSRNSSGLHFGFVGVGTTSVNADFKAVRSNVEREMQWASGRVQMDALLAPRRTTKFPVPAEISVGPQIFLNQGRTTDVRQGAGQNPPLVERNVEITITTLTAAGAPNTTANVTIEAPGLLRETTQANTGGKTRFRLRRFFTNGAGAQGFSTFAVKVRLGQIVKSFTVDL
jgi:hypothetical protein